METPGDGSNDREAPVANAPAAPVIVVRRRGVWWGEVVGAIVLASLIVIVLGATAVYILSSTDWGRERTRRYAEALLQKSVHGRVRIGKLSGNLLTGLVVEDFAITDSIGQPFIAIPRMRGDYGIGDLIHKRIWVDNVVLERPLIVLDRRPTGEWNWRRIFPRDTTPKPPRTQTGWMDRIRLTNLRILEGNLVMRTPWHPSRRLTPAAADSAIRAVLSGHERLMVERVTGGFQKIIELRSVTATLPLLRLSEPGYKERLARVAALEMQAYPFRPPAAEVRGLRGDLPFTDDSVWWHGVTVRLPNSVVSGDGSYGFKTGDLTITAHGAPTSFADMRWLYPRMPSNAGGTLDFDLRWRDAVEEYRAYNMSVHAGGARVAGSFGLTRGDSVTIHDTDLKFSGVDTRLIEQVLEGFDSPRRGTLSGHAKVAGGRSALRVDADVTFADQQGAGTSRVLAQGEIGFPGRGIRASNLHLDLRPVQVELARMYVPSLPISGVVTGTAVVNGSTVSALAIVADLDHADRGLVSRVAGRGTIHLGTRPTFDIDARAHPVSLAEIGRFFPSVGLQGVASGPFRVTGTTKAVAVNGTLALSGGGSLTGHADVDLTGAKRYDVALSMHTLDLHAVVAKAPATSLTARATARGVGTDLATMRSTIAADLATSRWDSVAVDTASVRVTISDGLLDVARFYAAGGHAVASARGAFGLTANRSGTLTYNVAIDSLAAFNRWIPGLQNDTTVVPPRPGLVARAVSSARADSARIARATEIERIVTGKAPPTLQVTMPRSVRRDSLGGTAYAAGTISGNLHDFDLRGRAGGEDVVARGNFIRRFQSEYVWTNARTPQSMLAVGLDADSVMAGGFALDSVGVRLSYHAPGGHVDVLVRQDDRRDYGLSGDYAISTARNELKIAALRLRLDTALWTSPHPAAIHWGGPGIDVQNLELRNRGNGRVYANGLLPTEGVANFELAVDNFPIGNVMDLIESDVQLSGLITLAGSMSGTLRDPTFRGAFGVVRGEYDGTALPELQGTFRYADQQLATHVDALRNGGRALATLDGRIPIDLAFSGVTGSRMLRAPMAVDLNGDSLPVELIPHFTDLVSNVHGRVAGSISMRGLLSRPSLTGGLLIANTTLTVNATGMTLYDVHGAIRMANDVVTFGSEQEPISGDAKGPVSMRGTIEVGSWRDPKLDLYLYSRNAEVLDNKWGKISADVGLALKGPLTAPYLSGGVTVVDGVIRAPNPTGKHLIGAGDPALFNVLDTAIVADRDLMPMHSSLLRSLRVDLTVEINRNTWVRNSDANVEIYTDYPLRVSLQNEAVSLTGVVTTDRGDYKFMSKRFAVTRGSAMFIGSNEWPPNPTLQVTGEYQVQQPGAPALDVKVLIGGTLKRPRLSLESDAQPPRSQSELLSLLAFGQSSTSLASLQGSSLAQSGTVGDYLGVGARRLTSVMMGVAVDQLEDEAGRKLGTDYFNITPADVPIELTNGGTLLAQTRFEGGKYLNPRTFVVGQLVGPYPGFRVQYRASEGWRYEASTEPRFVLLPPTLSKQDYRTRQAYGAFVIREWKF